MNALSAERITARQPRAKIASVIIQPTSFCNISCSYCYLDPTSRGTKGYLDAALLRTFLRDFVTSETCEEVVQFIFHHGEPLACGLDRMMIYVAAITDHCTRAGVKPEYLIQTNGTLLNHDWITFFHELNFNVGISFDLLEELHDAKRRTRSDNGTFHVVKRAIHDCVKAGLDPSVFIVIGPSLLARPQTVFEGLVGLGVRRVAINLDQITGSNHQSDSYGIVTRSQFESFFVTLYSLARQRGAQLQIRELETAFEALRHRSGIPWRSAVPMRYISLSADGSLSTFSPELTGQPSADGSYPFTFGRVGTDLPDSFIKSDGLRRYQKLIGAGIAKCRATCEYFAVCGGGNPANKLGENGSFDSSTTQFCELSVKGAIDAATQILIASVA